MRKSFISFPRVLSVGPRAPRLSIVASFIFLVTSLTVSASLCSGGSLNDRFIPDRGEPSSKPPHGFRVVGPAMLSKPTDPRRAPSDPRAMRGIMIQAIGISTSVAVERPALGGKAPLLNKAVLSAVNVSLPSVTGINHWWTYEEDAIPGGGRYMVNVGTGNLLVQYDDMDIPNKGIDLAFRRTYNSASTHDYANTDGSTPSNYGDGWTNTFDAHLATNNAGGLSIYDIDGARYDYVSNGAGGWTPPPGQYATLTWDGGNGYFWTKKSGTVYYFYAPNQPPLYAGFSGRLTEIFGRNHNNTIQFSYAFDNPSLPTAANLNTITATTEAGQAATLHFVDWIYGTANFRLLGTLTWPSGTAVAYHYRAGTELAAVDQPSNNSAGTLRSQSFGWSANHIIYNASSPIYTASSGSNGGYIGFALSGGRVTQVSYHAVVNPAIPDGTSSGVLQAAVATGMQQYKTVGYSTNLSTAETSVTDTDGHKMDYFWDAVGRVKYVHAWSSATAFLPSYEVWDAQNNLIATLDPRSSGSTDTTYRTDFAYDSNGNTIAVALPSIATSQGTFRPTSLYSYDASNNVTAYCDPIASHAHGSDWTAPPAASDSLCSPLSDTARYAWAQPSPVPPAQTSYEPFGQLMSVTTPGTPSAPSGYLRNFLYSAAAQGGSDYGLPTSVTGSSIAQYDATNRQPQQSFTYDAYGNLSTYNKGNGSWALGYDLLNRLLSSRSPDGPATYKSYYANGQVQLSESPAQHASGTGVAFSYDTDGNQVQETHHYANQPGTTQKWYDGDDRLVEVQLPHDTSDYFSFNSTTRYLYDLSKGSPISIGPVSGLYAHGNLFKTQEYVPMPYVQGGPQAAQGSPSWTDVRGTTFDALDRSLSAYELAFGNAPKQTNTYDTAGNLGLLNSSRNAVGQQSSYSYNAVGEASQTSFSDSTPSRMYVSDPDGRSTAITSSVFGTQSYAYDAQGNVISSSEPSGGGLNSPATLTYGYYPDGMRKSISAQSGALTQTNLLQYAYRADSALAHEAATYNGTWNFNWTYTDGGDELTESDPYTGTTVHPTSHFSGGIGPLAYPATLTLQPKTYTYDLYGRVSWLTIPMGSAYKNFTYDNEDEVTTYNAYYTANTQSALSGDTFGYNIRGELLGNAPFHHSSANGFVCDAQTVCGKQFDDRNAMNFGTPPTSGGDNWHYSYDAAGRATGVDSHDYKYPGNPQTGSMTRSYDAENHMTGQAYSGGFSTPTIDLGDHIVRTGLGAPTGGVQYGYGPNGHPVKAVTPGAWFTYNSGYNSVAETLHWDGNTLLFTTDATGRLDDLKIGKLADITPTPYGTGTPVIYDRNWTGTQVTSHWSGGFSGWGPIPMYHGRPLMRTDKGAPPSGDPADDYTPPEQHTPISSAAPDGYSDGINTFQGVRAYDPVMQTWTAPDAYAGNVHDPMSQKPFMWNRNNPILYSDPSGYCIEDACVSEGVAAAYGALAILSALSAKAGSDSLHNWAEHNKASIDSAVAHAFERAKDLLHSREKNPAQDKRLTPGEIKDLKKRGIDPERLKKAVTGDKNTGKYDLFKDRNGDVVVKPRSGSGPGEPTGEAIPK